MSIRGLDEAGSVDGVKVFHAGTILDDDKRIARCNGGRVLAVTGMGSNLPEALAASYKAVKRIAFVDDSTGNDGLMHHRTDIAKGAVQRRLRIGVLGSTRGTALIPVMEACANGTLHAEIVAVLSDRSSALILEKGRSLGVTVTTKFLSAKGLSRDQFDAECTSVLVGAGVEYVLLVGYMRILSKGFVNYWAGRCINVHPSLLPKHSGGMDLAVSLQVV
jgi:phosphoribosylamine--glycine ligase/phosphoribosylglycinamide formyltransferase/phosphoribosylformylglycinamidine cyclo-ligase/phosphoribosylamine--glycine ligase/phosphoribosylformylglycinamidine cyclo-ligase